MLFVSKVKHFVEKFMQNAYFLVLFIKNRKQFPMRTAHKLVNRYQFGHFIAAAGQRFCVAHKCGWIARNIDYAPNIAFDQFTTLRVSAGTRRVHNNRVIIL